MTEPGITFSTVAERFAWNLRIARRRAGFTQRELAAQIGKDQSRVALWEGGGCLPRTATLVRLAEALEIDPGELLRETKGLAS
jgi:transcriptional regulator with XRE-family HTH domain